MNAFADYGALKMRNLTTYSNLFFFFSFSREKGAMENPESLDLKSLKVPRALKVQTGNGLRCS